MRQMHVFSVLAFLMILLTACGKTQFSSADGSSLKLSSVSASGEAAEPSAPTVSDLVNNPELANDFSCEHGNKVEICHVPPGNPAARHTLCIGAPAVNAHIAEHQGDSDADDDKLGACKCDHDNDKDDDKDTDHDKNHE